MLLLQLERALNLKGSAQKSMMAWALSTFILVSKKTNRQMSVLQKTICQNAQFASFNRRRPQSLHARFDWEDVRVWTCELHTWRQTSYYLCADAILELPERKILRLHPLKVFFPELSSTMSLHICEILGTTCSAGKPAVSYRPPK